jgi:hypothetical protein
MSTVLNQVLPVPDAPYRGIRPFRFLDQQIFKARDDETWELLSKVTLYRAVLLYGDSGTGKSSLINAGLIPEVFKDNLTPHRLRIQPFVGREIRVERMLKSTGSERTYLPCSFAPVGGDEDLAAESGSFELSLADFRQQLRNICKTPPTEDPVEPDPGANFASPPFSRLLLIFDQFEEFITLFEESQRVGDVADAKRRQMAVISVQTRILVTLVKLIRGDLPIKIVFVFREDYFAKLTPLLDYCPELLDQAQRLLPPRLHTLPEIILAPFADPTLRSHFLPPNAKSGSELNKPMAERIAADLRKRSESDLVNLSELQIVCLLLWQSPNPEALYGRLGIPGLLEQYGTDVFLHLRSELQDKAVALMATMLTTSNTRNIVSDADLRRTAEKETLSRTEYNDVIDALCRNQIVRRERHRNLHFYELASEYLVPWINKLAADRELLKANRKAEEERKRAEAQRLRAEDEQQRARRFRGLLIASCVLLAVLLVVGVMAGYFYKRSVRANTKFAAAEARRLSVQQQKEEADAKVRLAEMEKPKYLAAITLIAGKKDAEKRQAMSQIRAWSEEGTFSPEFVLLLAAAQSTTENPQIKRELSQVLARVKEALARAAQTDANLSQSIGIVAEANTSMAQTLPLQFNIYLADESQHNLGQKTAAALKQHGYVVLPGVAVGEGIAPNWDNELRYFRRPEQGQPELSDILKILKIATGSTNWKAAYNPQFANSPRGRAGQLELWFAKPAGHLDVGFIDEDGKPLENMRFVLTFEPIDNKGVRFTSSSEGVTVPSGEYNVTIRVKDHKDLHQRLLIAGAQRIEWYNLKLIKEKIEP